jgi:hypothetical protein
LRLASILTVLLATAFVISNQAVDTPTKPLEPVLRVYEHPDISTPPIPVITPSVAIIEPEPEKKIRVGNPEGNRAYARSRMDKWGWDEHQFHCLVHLWERESNWNHTADNPTSSAYGIPQALPGHKMSTVGDDWGINPKTQIKWGLKYISERYSTPCNAWKHFQNKNWY